MIMKLKISKHAYKRARQRLGLNKKAFKRMVEEDRVPEHCSMVILNNVIVTVKNLYKATRDNQSVMSKEKRLKCLMGE